MNPNRNARHDIILRTIMQFADMFTAVLKKKQAGQIAEAKYELEQLYSTAFGLDYKMILAMDVGTLKTLVGDVFKIRTLIQVLNEHALLNKSLGNIESSKSCSKKAEQLENL